MALFTLTCRNFNRYYKYTLFSPLFLFINSICFGLNYHNIFKEINIKNIFISEEEPKEFRQFFIRQMFCYLVTIIFSFLFYKIENYKKGEALISSKKENEEHNNEKKNSQIELIHQQSVSINYSNTFFLKLLFIILLWVILDLILEKFHNILKHLDFWMLELIFLSIFSKTILNINIYTHQIAAMILTIFPLLLKIVTIILSFFDEQIEGTNFEIPYVKNIWLLPVGTIIYSILILLKAYIKTKIKWYMDIKYISSHKLLFLYGIISVLFYLIICTISTFNECEKTYFLYNTSYNSTKNAADYFCEIQENKEINMTINETTKYLTNFKIYFTSFDDVGESLLEILAVSLGAASFFFYKYLVDDHQIFITHSLNGYNSFLLFN